MRFTQRNIRSGRAVLVAAILSSFLPGCGTSSTSPSPVAVTDLSTKTVTVGAQTNATIGSFFDIDAMVAYSASEVKGSSTIDSAIDLFYGDTTVVGFSSSAVYSPDLADGNGSIGLAGFNGFPTAAILRNPARATAIRAISNPFASVHWKSELDSLWAKSSGAEGSQGKLDLKVGATFLVESNKGLKVLLQASGIVRGSAGQALFTIKGKF